MKKINNLKKFDPNYLKNFIFSILFLVVICFWGRYWSQYGIDISDSGFFLHAQDRLIKNQANGISPSYLWIGSDFLGALWLKLNPNISLHFAKTGAYILYGIIMLIGYFTLFRITKNSTQSFKVTIISYVLFGSLYIFPIINYDLAPLLPISIILLLSTYLTKTKKDILVFFFVGVLSFIIILMRLPMLLFVFCITSLFFYKYKSLNNLFSFSIGFFITILIFILIPTTNNLLHLYFDTLIEIIKPIIRGTIKNPRLSLFESFNYTIKDQIFFWLRGYFRIIFVFVFLFLIHFISLKINSKKNKIIFDIIIIISTLLFTYYPLEEYSFFSSINITIIQFQFIYNYILPVIIFITIFYLLLEKSVYLDQIFLLFFIFILLPLGSNSFEKKLSLTYFLVLPILYCVYNETISSNKRLLIIRQFINWLFKIFAIPVLFLVFFKSLNSPYRDLPINKLNTEFKSVSLKNIYSTKEKVEAIDPIVNWLLINKKSNSSLLSIERTAIFNYLTGIPGVFDYPYPIYLSLNYFKSHLFLLKSSNKLPDFIIIPKVDISNPNWPIDKNPNTIPNNYKTFLNEFIISNSYNIEFETEYFQIFKRQLNSNF